MRSFSIAQRCCRRASRHFATVSQYTQVPTLRDGKVETFRKQAFEPAVPVLLPKGHFEYLPAVWKWFEGAKTGLPQLNPSYLAKFGNTVVPLEFSRYRKDDNGDMKQIFETLDGPLSLFLEWTRQASEIRDVSLSRDRLYLAQARVINLPIDLIDDLPVPPVVLQAGRGDIYDVNIWIGLAPTYTPLHRDPNPNMFVQLAGRKTVRLFKPRVGSEIYHQVQAQLGRDASANMRGTEMFEGEEKQLLEEEVWVESSEEGQMQYEGYEAHVEAGDGLFIPKGWWHSIKGIGEGVTGSVNWWFR